MDHSFVGTTLGNAAVLASLNAYVTNFIQNLELMLCPGANSTASYRKRHEQFKNNMIKQNVDS